MSNYRKFIRKTKLGKNTLQDVLKYADSHQDRLSIIDTPSETIREIYNQSQHGVEVDYDFVISQVNLYLDFLTQREKDYREARVKAVTALKETLRLFKEEFPNATKEETQDFLETQQLEIYRKFHTPKHFQDFLKEQNFSV